MALKGSAIAKELGTGFIKEGIGLIIVNATHRQGCGLSQGAAINRQ